MKPHIGRSTLRVAVKMASLALLLAVPCLAIMAFGPGLMQVLASDNVQVNGNAIQNQNAIVASTPAAKAKAASQNQMPVLTAWEETSQRRLAASKFAALRDSAALKATVRLTPIWRTMSPMLSVTPWLLKRSCRLHLRSANRVTAMLPSVILRIAAQDEQKAASNLVCAAQLAIGLNPTLANKPGGLVSLAIQLQTIATTLNLETTTAEFACPLSMYIRTTILPTAQQGVTTDNQAWSQVSDYRTSRSGTSNCH